MSSLGTNLKRMAVKIIAREGQSCTVSFVDSDGTYDPSTGTNTPAAVIDKTVKVVNHKPFFFFKLLKKFCRALMKLNN